MMGIQEFGDRLIETRDLDPLYVGLVGARAQGMGQPQLARWLLSYWCFYHAGAASFMSEREGGDYWQVMLTAASNVNSPRLMGCPADRWPRAAERRHFRGAKCRAAVVWLQVNSAGIPEAPVMDLARQPGSGSLTEMDVMRRVVKWPMFGPWVAFKVADMLERVWGLDIKFNPNIGLMYREPRAALDLIPAHHPTWHDPRPENIYPKLLTYFSARRAPPEQSPRQRYCGAQELETILCKWKSYLGGHYWLGKDIHEQREALKGWGATADRVAGSYPPEVKDAAEQALHATA